MQQPPLQPPVMHQPPPMQLRQVVHQLPAAPQPQVIHQPQVVRMQSWTRPVSVTLIPASPVPRRAVLFPAQPGIPEHKILTVGETARENFGKTSLWFWEYLQKRQDEAVAAGVGRGQSWTKRYRLNTALEESPSCRVRSLSDMQREDDNEGSVFDIWNVDEDGEAMPESIQRDTHPVGAMPHSCGGAFGQNPLGAKESIQRDTHPVGAMPHSCGGALGQNPLGAKVPVRIGAVVQPTVIQPMVLRQPSQTQHHPVVAPPGSYNVRSQGHVQFAYANPAKHGNVPYPAPVVGMHAPVVASCAPASPCGSPPLGPATSPGCSPQISPLTTPHGSPPVAFRILPERINR
eukprot:TRINITY_DN3574_c0_g1_i1.p1 TRINITY_DN3574_c0_g1~~TRINITY_DN3574_c0_g1_i1.p1  ORF type:complete len:346 (+),score=37.78 TRINITY_DN3574_c0_g1_i1:53-1090(+)